MLSSDLDLNGRERDDTMPEQENIGGKLVRVYRKVEDLDDQCMERFSHLAHLILQKVDLEAKPEDLLPNGKYHEHHERWLRQVFISGYWDSSDVPWVGPILRRSLSFC